MDDEPYVDPLIEATKVGHLGTLPEGSPDRATLGQAHQLPNYSAEPRPVQHMPARGDGGELKVGGTGDGDTDPLEGVTVAGGWYTFPDGTKVQGRDAALEHAQGGAAA